MAYAHLTREQRYSIYTALGLNATLTHIGRQLGKDKSSISREVSANGGRLGYCPVRAHEAALARVQGNKNAQRFKADDWALVSRYIVEGCSPEQVAKRLGAEQQLRISHERIYGYVYADKKSPQSQGLHLHLRCQKPYRKRGGSYKRRGTIRNRVGIEQRPAIVELRERQGDWEGDTVIGKAHSGVIVTMVDRTSRYLTASLAPTKHAEPVSEAIIEMLKHRLHPNHTITFDNGKEFADHDFIAKRLKVQVYFADPYCSWQRGTNENTNGLLRQYFPKKTNFQQITQQQLDDAVYRLNHRPRKCLGWRTPHEVYHGSPITPLHR